MEINEQVKKRRTFAIISHPDAGKTTLTEKLLLYGGAIHLAGAVRAKKNQKDTTSDWMEIERQRGISVTASVLNFEYHDTVINLLDTPGHKDFSEDTYRTLTAADCAVMLLDAAKGVEPQTRKLFEVCRMRKIPIFTFINKMDRPGRDPLDLIDELEKVLGIRSTPVSWPIGSPGDTFRGIYDLQKKEIILYDRGEEAYAKKRIDAKSIQNLDDPSLPALLEDGAKTFVDGKALIEQLKTDIELLSVAGDAYDIDRILEGELTPLFFGSALTNFGLEGFLEKFIELAPTPAPRKSNGVEISPVDPAFSAFVFKIQANMDPSHRDRVAFLRVCSGKFSRNMEVKHTRLKKTIRLSRPLNFFAQERVIIDEAWPGDIIGMVDTTGDLRIGDTLCEKMGVEFDGIPRFSPEYFSAVTILDPLKRKQLKTGLDQLSEEGVVQVYQQPGLGERDPVLAAVGGLQFEVLKFRLKAEYSVDVKMSPLGYTHARWPVGETASLKKTVDELSRREDSKTLLDRDQNPVVLFKSQWAMNWAINQYKEVTFQSTAPLLRAAGA